MSRRPIHFLARLANLGRRLLHWVGVLLMFAPAVIIRAISPIFTIRVQEIFSSRLGHFASEPDMYLSARAILHQSPRTLDLFYFDEYGACNAQLAAMWKRRLIISPIFRYLDRAIRLLPGWHRHQVPWNDIAGTDLRSKTAPFLALSDAEHIQGEARLEEIAGADHRPVVCVFNRDTRYLAERYPGKDWSYHDYRDSNISNYVPAMEWLAESGYTVMRMGAAVADTFTTKNPHVIDYASKYHDDFMDVFLYAHCNFHVSATSGPPHLGALFRKPAAFINTAPFLTTIMTECVHPDEVFIPKLYFSNLLGRCLTISEIVTANLEDIGDGRRFAERGITLIENDPQDLLSITQEIEGIVTGRNLPSLKDRRLQAAFWKAAGIDTEAAKMYPQPSPAFLRKYDEILF